MDLCPCGSTKAYASCCGLYHAGEPAPTPESLMRSRYTAFALKKIEYLETTTDPQTRDSFDAAANARWAAEAEFTGLEILSAREEGTKGFVEFRARYRIGATEHSHHEKSRFRKQAGVWYFREGKVLEPQTGS